MCFIATQSYNLLLTRVSEINVGWTDRQTDGHDETIIYNENIRVPCSLGKPKNEHIYK